MANNEMTPVYNAEKQRTSQVNEQMEGIEKAMSQVDGSMGRLEDRLHAVLR
jgi:hypothetical protein